MNTPKLFDNERDASSYAALMRNLPVHMEDTDKEIDDFADILATALELQNESKNIPDPPHAND